MMTKPPLSFQSLENRRPKNSNDWNLSQNIDHGLKGRAK